MIAARLDITITAGITLGPIVINCKQADGEPVDLTGYSVWAQVRKNYKGELIHDLSPTITDEAAGEITISQDDEATAAITSLGNCQWDLILENPSGARLGPYVSGACLITKPLTQP